MKEIRIERVRIRDLMRLLTKVSVFSDAVDLIINTEEKSIIIEPILPPEGKMDTDERSDTSKFN